MIKTGTKTLLLLTIAVALMGQAPNPMNFPIVVRDKSGKIVANAFCNFQFQVHNDSITGNVLHIETDTATTNKYGLATVKSVKLMEIFHQLKLGPLDRKAYLQTGVDTTGGIIFMNIYATLLNSPPMGY